jgi:uncharacterized protein YdhG (YjbR/CyaY superfamily)
MKSKAKSAPRTTGKASTGASTRGFTEEERAAMREHARELRAASRGADGEAEVLAKIAEMPEADRVMAERVHAVIKAAAPSLGSRTWYGMPAYTKDGNVICFFRNASKFKSRYATLGFNDRAKLDDGDMWPTDFAVVKLTPAVEKRITALVKTAVG